MASDPIAYFKWLKVGDFLQSLPDLTPEIEPAQVTTSVEGNTAKINEGGANARFLPELKHALHRSSSETYREFYLRRVAYAENLASVAGRGGTYSSAGALVIVDHSENDVTTLSSSVTAGSDVDVALTDDIDVAVGDYMLITDGTASYEVVQAKSGTSGATVRCDPSLSWAGTETAARVLFYFPSAYLTEMPQITATTDGSTQATYDMTAGFLALGVSYAS